MTGGTLGYNASTIIEEKDDKQPTEVRFSEPKYGIGDYIFYENENRQITDVKELVLETKKDYDGNFKVNAIPLYEVEIEDSPYSVYISEDICKPTEEAYIKKIPIGGLWEEKEWEIGLNQVISDSVKPCKHCHSHKTLYHRRNDGSYYTIKSFICPRVVIGTNEGGCNSTGICLDCILENAKKLDENVSQKKDIEQRITDIEDAIFNIKNEQDEY